MLQQWLLRAPPVVCSLRMAEKEFADGFGLYSPGRWALEVMEKLRRELASLLLCPEHALVVPDRRPFILYMLSQSLEIHGGPDWKDEAAGMMDGLHGLVLPEGRVRQVCLAGVGFAGADGSSQWASTSAEWWASYEAMFAFRYLAEGSRHDALKAPSRPGSPDANRINDETIPCANP
mgnify:CR=1 FL=1